MNTKYISSNVLKISGISRVRSTSDLLIFSTHEMKYFWYLLKKINFLFIFSVEGKKLNFFDSYFSLILPGSAGLVGIIWVSSLHLENGLLCHFNDWIKRNLRF